MIALSILMLGRSETNPALGFVWIVAQVVPLVAKEAFRAHDIRK
jgi:hypothetical protein